MNKRSAARWASRSEEERKEISRKLWQQQKSVQTEKRKKKRAENKQVQKVEKKQKTLILTDPDPSRKTKYLPIAEDEYSESYRIGEKQIQYHMNKDQIIQKNKRKKTQEPKRLSDGTVLIRRYTTSKAMTFDLVDAAEEFNNDIKSGNDKIKNLSYEIKTDGKKLYASFFYEVDLLHDIVLLTHYSKIFREAK